jgi:hypothetical protein
MNATAPPAGAAHPRGLWEVILALPRTSCDAAGGLKVFQRLFRWRTVSAVDDPAQGVSAAGAAAIIELTDPALNAGLRPR